MTGKPNTLVPDLRTCVGNQTVRGYTRTFYLHKAIIDQAPKLYVIPEIRPLSENAAVSGIVRRTGERTANKTKQKGEGE